MARTRNTKTTSEDPTGAPPEELSREVTLEQHRTTIRLSDIDRDKMKHIFCHRDSKELGANAPMQALVESLVSEGQITPIEFYRDPDGAAILVRGYRIVEAHYQVIGKQLDPANFKEDMDLKAVELTGGTEVDYLIRAISSNEVRALLSEEAKYQAAAMLLERKVPAIRAARALGISATLFGRYIRRYNNRWIQQHVTDGHIIQSDADDLLEAAAKNNAFDALQQSLGQAIAEATAHITRLEEQAKITKAKLPKNATLVKTYLKGAKFKKQLTDALPKGGIPQIKLNLDAGVGAGLGSRGSTTFEFECKLDPKDGKLKIAGLNGIALSQLGYEDLAALSFKITSLAEEVTTCFLTKQATRASVQQHDTLLAQITYYEKHGAQDLADKLKAQLAPSGSGNGKGKGNGQKKPAARTETPITDRITTPPKPASSN